MELQLADLSTKSDDLRSPYESKGAKAVAAPIKLETGNSLKGTLHYTAEFIPCLALKNIKFETQTTEKDRVASHDHDDRSSTSGSVYEDDDVPIGVTYKPEPTASSDVHPVPTTNDVVPVAVAADVKTNETGEPNVIADKKPEIEGVELTHEELLAHREWCLWSALVLLLNSTLESGIIVFHIISGRLSKKGRLEVLLDDAYWPCLSTVKARKLDAQWDYVGEGFIKEIDFALVWLRLNLAAEGDKDDIVAEWKGDAKPFLQATLVSFVTFACVYYRD